LLAFALPGSLHGIQQTQVATNREKRVKVSIKHEAEHKKKEIKYEGKASLSICDISNTNMLR